MEHDKTTYRIRRQQGLRGQQEPYIKKRGAVFLKRDIKGYPIPVKEGGMPYVTKGGMPYTSGKPVSKKALRKNTKRARKAALNG